MNDKVMDVIDIATTITGADKKTYIRIRAESAEGMREEFCFEEHTSRMTGSMVTVLSGQMAIQRGAVVHVVNAHLMAAFCSGCDIILLMARTEDIRNASDIQISLAQTPRLLRMRMCNEGAWHPSHDIVLWMSGVNQAWLSLLVPADVKKFLYFLESRGWKEAFLLRLVPAVELFCLQNLPWEDFARLYTLGKRENREESSFQNT